MVHVEHNTTDEGFEDFVFFWNIMVNVTLMKEKVKQREQRG